MRVIVLFCLITFLACDVFFGVNTKGANYEYFYPVSMMEHDNDEYITVWNYIDTKISGYPSLYVIMTDGSGGKIWSRKLLDGKSTDMIKTINGEYLITGSEYSSNFLTLSKLDKNFNLIWKSKYVSNSFHDYYHEATKLIETDDKGFIVLGYNSRHTHIFSKVNGLILKCNINGEVIKELVLEWIPTDIIKSHDSQGYIVIGENNFIKITDEIDIVLKQTFSHLILLINYSNLGYKTIGVKKIDDSSHEVHITEINVEGEIISSKRITSVNDENMFNILKGVQYEEDIFIIANDNRTETPLISAYMIDLNGNYKWKRIFENSQTAAIKYLDNKNYALLLEGLRFFKLSNSGDILFEKIIDK
ncbi:MAG: hypothetical protein N2746_11005 [Deltaproteobacteria bacterium]|nr:hypothetical protein [Deltaproteobacteria bacterium]